MTLRILLAAVETVREIFGLIHYVWSRAICINKS